MACHPVRASEFAHDLLGFYPAREVNNAKVFAAGMTALFVAYPQDLVKRVCDPVRGLPSRLKWLPTIADAREALDAEKLRRDRIAANARWVLKEAEKREREAEWDRSHKTVDGARVAELVSGLKAMPIVEPLPVRNHSVDATAMVAVSADIAARRAAMTPEQLAEHEATIAALSPKPEEKAA